MKDALYRDLRPRKVPRQARALVTVASIVEATIQVLKKPEVFTSSTTGIAERAGVSVGTLYQYFPHRNSLVYEALQRHLDSVAVAIEELCQKNRGKTIECLVVDFANGYVDLKIARAADRATLHGHMTELGMVQAKDELMDRAALAVANLLATAPDVKFTSAEETAAVLLREVETLSWPAMRDAENADQLDRIRCSVVAFVRHFVLQQSSTVS